MTHLLRSFVFALGAAAIVGAGAGCSSASTGPGEGDAGGAVVESADASTDGGADDASADDDGAAPSFGKGMTSGKH